MGNHYHPNGDLPMPDATTTDDTTTTTTDAATTTDTTTTDDTKVTDWEAEAQKWKQFSRKHEDEVKALRPKAAAFDEAEEKNKTELQRAHDERDATRTEAQQTKVENAVLKAAVKHKLSEDDAALLADNVGTHGTQDEITERADKLAARLAATAASKGKPDMGGGDRGEDIAGIKQATEAELAAMTPEQINKARSEGRLQALLG